MSKKQKFIGYIKTIYWNINKESKKKCFKFVSIINYKPKRIKYKKI